MGEAQVVGEAGSCPGRRQHGYLSGAHPWVKTLAPSEPLVGKLGSQLGRKSRQNQVPELWSWDRDGQDHPGRKKGQAGTWTKSPSVAGEMRRQEVEGPMSQAQGSYKSRAKGSMTANNSESCSQWNNMVEVGIRT